MLNFVKQQENEKIEKILSRLIKGNSFCINGLTSFLRLFLLKYIANKKKVLFITASEQKALKYKNDLMKLFEQTSSLFPYQDVSMYDGISPNLYKYAEQLNILQTLETQNIVLMPIKALLEKFPTKDFFNENSIKIKIDEDIDTIKLAHQLATLGYKRATMVVDIGEFSIRGDIVDIYGIDKAPIRIELWGDTVTDIRYFNPENQRSFEKIKEVEISPIYKFIIDNSTQNILKIYGNEISEKIENEKYFEGIEGYRTTKGVKTFSKKVLKNLLEESGYQDVWFAYPYPDYK